MAQEPECNAGIYSPKDTVFLRCDGRIGFSPRGVAAPTASEFLIGSPTMDVGYLGKEEFNPERKAETVEKIARLAEMNLPRVGDLSTHMAVYLGGVGSLSALVAMQHHLGMGDEALFRYTTEMVMNPGLFDAEYTAAQERVVALGSPHTERIMGAAESYAEGIVAADMHWLGFEPDVIRRVIEESRGKELEPAAFEPLFQQGLERLATDRAVAEAVFDSVSESIARDLSLAQQEPVFTPGGFGMTISMNMMGGFGPVSAPLPAPKWEFPESEAMRKKVLATHAAFDEDIKPLLSLPLKDKEYTLLLSRGANISEISPQSLGGKFRAGLHDADTKTIYLCTGEIQGRFNFEDMMGRPPVAIYSTRPFPPFNVSHSGRTEDYPERQAEETIHAALRIVFKNRGLPYAENDRSAKAAVGKLAETLQERPELQKMIDFDLGFSNETLVHKEMVTKALAAWAVRGKGEFEKEWPEMATFAERFVLNRARAVEQGVGGRVD